MDRAGDWICGVVRRRVWERGVVHGVGEEAGVWAFCDLPDYFGDIGAVFCGEVGGVGRDWPQRHEGRREES